MVAAGSIGSDLVGEERTSASTMIRQHQDHGIAGECRQNGNDGFCSSAANVGRRTDNMATGADARYFPLNNLTDQETRHGRRYEEGQQRI